MKIFVRIAAVLCLLMSLSCARKEPEANVDICLPEGTPVTLNIGFGYPSRNEVKIETKAEATRADESRIHDLYVMLFDGNGDKFYGRYFTYEHLITSLDDLDSHSNEGWYVENSDNSRGVVKIATQAKDNCTLVLLANVTSTITSLNHRDPVDVLAGLSTYDDLTDVRVTLEQEVLNRGDLFMMMDKLTGVSTGSLTWGTISAGNAIYNKPGDEYQLKLRALDAKVKFYITYNTDNINPDKCDPRKWWVYNVPSECFLIPQEGQPSDIDFFDTEKAYFEGRETVNGKEWEVFSFYMLENCQDPKQSIMAEGSPSYYLREKETDPAAEESNFIYAPKHGTYVRFDMLLGLTNTGVDAITGGNNAAHALTTEALYTVHLGDFVNSSEGDGRKWDNYDVNRSTSYSYFITINNSRSIYVEVLGEDGDPDTDNGVETQPGQEGSLLLSTDEVVNCDSHYEYHCLTFRYIPELEGRKVSWYVKTPFDEGGAQWDPDANGGTGDWNFNCKDYLWVKFGKNEISGSTYSHNRAAYPGNTYVANWDHTTGLATNQLMDIHQLYNYILDQTKKKNGGQSNDFLQESDDPSTPEDESLQYVIRVTAFIDEYYYEKDPTLDPATAPADPELWRKFVNADPRELHILSEAVYSKDLQSDVITSSHSIIQQSIQTFYNTYSPDLRTLWGTEHIDEMEYRIRLQKDPSQTIWPWWPDDRSLPTSAKPNSADNGRLNSAALWGVAGKSSWNEATAPAWNTFLNYTVDNDHPELEDDYKYLAYSCLTRNRDNNGNHKIDPDEVRWYIASANQLIGMWVGNESLTPSARIYQPENKNDISDGRQWRAWVVSSTASTLTDPVTIRAEEGCTKSDYNFYNWTNNPQFTSDDRNRVSSVRCVRNIGTYTNNGEVEDISSADFDQMVDQYYESPAGFDANGKVLPNADGSYTLRFSRLEPRSIREYTSVDLPYHEEYSMHNRVYLELNLQNPDNYAYTDGTGEGSMVYFAMDEEEINDDITASGHNSFCPYGYRLPSMTEMAMMVALLPNSYWTNGKIYPSRTYYSRGLLGSKVTTGEHGKVGWGYSYSNNSRFHLLDSGTSMTGIRCVRDNNCTGEITGNISIAGADKLHMGDDCIIKLNFTSMGSAIKSLNLNLVYVTASGSEDTRPISTSGIKLSGVSIRDAEVPWTVPDDLTLLGNMSIRAEVTNNAGIRKVVEAPIRILSPVFASVRLLPCDYNADTDDLDNPAFPVLVTASSPSSAITSWKLTIKDPDKEFTNVTLAADNRDTHFWNVRFNYNYTMSSLMTGKYTFQLEVFTADGVHTRSNIAAMDVLRINYHPNQRTDYVNSTEINRLWEPDVVEGMNLFGGDFIEANMDITNCTYIAVYNTDPETGEFILDGKGNKVRNNDLTIGRDNLISIGISDTDHNTTLKVPYVYHIYYPAHDGGDTSGQDWVRPNITTSAGASNGTNYKLFNGGDGTGFVLQSAGKYKPDITKRQHFRLDRNGGYWNNQWMDTANWAADGQDGVPATALASQERILSSDTFYIGSTQGLHHSRARYCFVRAVYNSSESNAAGGDISFTDDPIDGGNL